MTTQQIENIQLELGLLGLNTNGMVYVTDTFIATASQVNFTLAFTPQSGTLVTVNLNGRIILQAAFSVSTNVMTLVTPSTVSDVVSVQYYT